MKVKDLPEFDPAEYLDTDEAVTEYLTAALETGDVAFITDALGVVARAKGMTQIAHDAGLSRESLYKALRSEGNPTFATVLKVMHAMGLKLTATPIHAPA
jgi:probable addiction module antidote protein